jgi:hypothetical protein
VTGAMAIAGSSQKRDYEKRAKVDFTYHCNAQPVLAGSTSLSKA